jgi:DNA repair protein RadC
LKKSEVYDIIFIYKKFVMIKDGQMTHDKHRERMRKKLLEGVNLEDHEILEMLLYYSLPRINTNEIAHSLIDNRGSFGAVFTSDTVRLMRTKGVGERSAILCRLVGETVKRSMMELCDTSKLLTSHTELTKYFCALFYGCQFEQVFAIGFDDKKKYLRAISIGDGLYDEAVIQVRRAIISLCKHNCKSVIIVHNHTTGILKASEMDMNTAEKLGIIFGHAGISIEGHYVYADGQCIKFADNNRAELLSAEQKRMK